MDSQLKRFAKFYASEYLFTIKTDEIIRDNSFDDECVRVVGRYKWSELGCSGYEKKNFPVITKNYYKDPEILEMFIAGPDITPSNLVKKIAKIYTRVEYGNQFVTYTDYDFKIKY